jgi:hypothetical protein
MTKNYSLKNLMALNKKYLMTESEVVDNHWISVTIGHQKKKQNFSNQ